MPQVEIRASARFPQSTCSSWRHCSTASTVAKVTNPNPRGALFRRVVIITASTTSPYLPKCSRNTSSVTLGARPPTKTFFECGPATCDASCLPEKTSEFSTSPLEAMRTNSVLESIECCMVRTSFEVSSDSYLSSANSFNGSGGWLLVILTVSKRPYWLKWVHTERVVVFLGRFPTNR